MGNSIEYWAILILCTFACSPRSTPSSTPLAALDSQAIVRYDQSIYRWRVSLLGSSEQAIG